MNIYTTTNYKNRWVKFLKNISYTCPVGTYDFIEEDNENSSCIVLVKYRTCSRQRLNNGDLELMPEGWSPDTEDIPEYAKCISTSRNCYGELGKVYKVKDWNHSLSDCMLEGTTSGSTAKSRFRPSTKEAYDAQQSTFEIPEYLECIDNSGIDNYGVIGRIYKFSKVSGPHSYWGVTCNLDCGSYKPGDTLYFHPHQLDTSNKEKYDAQVKSSIPTHVKCVSAISNAKVGVIYPVIDESKCLCENNTRYNWISRQFIPSNLEEYGQQFVSSSTPVNQYTKGKWYTCDKWKGDYIKLDYVKHEQAYFTECVLHSHVEKKDWWSIVGYSLIKADMNIVSKLLPDGHPDKINTSSLVKEWSKGTYVVITGNYHSVKIGEVHEIDQEEEDFVSISKSVGKPCLPFKDVFRWFATRDEAIAFSELNYPKATTVPIKDIGKLVDSKINITYGDCPSLQKTKPLIEDVQSISVNLRTKKQINKFKI